MKKMLLLLPLLAILIRPLWAEEPPSSAEAPAEQASSPVPGDMSVNAPITQILSWSKNAHAICYVVNLYSLNPPTGRVATTTENNFTPGALNYSTVYYWWIDTVNSSGMARGDIWSFSTVPLTPPEQASLPVPNDGMTNTPIAQSLGWAAASRAASYDVYLGTANLPVSPSASTTGASYNPAALSYSTKYYWRVDSKNSVGTTTGLVWNFTTAPKDSPVTANSPSPAKGANTSGDEAAPIFNFPSEMINLKTPSQDGAKDVIMFFDHRFLGQLRNDPFTSAHVELGVKYMATSDLELESSYASSQQEYNLGAGYKFLNKDLIQGQFNLYYFDYKEFAKRSNNVFYLLSLSSKPVLKRFVPIVNVGYDNYNQRYGYGYGLKTQFATGAETVERIELMAEYFPFINPQDGITNAKRTFCFGINLGTFSHNIVLTVGNNTELGTRRAMLGAPNQDLHFGFNLNKKF